jgi:hypothetical protein
LDRGDDHGALAEALFSHPVQAARRER